MNCDPREDVELTVEMVHRVEAVCTIFEEQWISGQRPIIEDLLSGRESLERSMLLRELLALEFEYRQLSGEQPTPSEYAQRFPVHRNIIDLAFREAEQSPSHRPEASSVNRVDVKPDQEFSNELPRLFGDYQLLEEIARGGMGVVYRARQISLDRIVAVKMILAGVLASEAEVDRFYLETQAVARLEHPNIVPIIEVGQWRGQRYFSMGFVDGISLAERIAGGSLLPRDAAQLMLSVCDALDYAHQRGIIHRDLKPANILLDTLGRPHVTDFGLAKRVSSDDPLTVTGQLIGTPSFMPPEQATGKTESIGVASDVYSLGAVLYTALTGRPPFQAASALDTLQQVVEQDAVPPRRLDPTVPRDLETMALKCLEKNPARRYGSAQALAAELRRYLSGEPILARPVGFLERSSRWYRRNRVVSALASIVVTLLIAVSVMSTLAALRIGGLRDEAVKQQGDLETARSRAEQHLQYAHGMIRQLAESYGLLSDQQHRSDERLEWYRKAHSLFLTLAQDSPSSLDYQSQLAGSFSRLGLLHARAGQDALAMSAFDQSVEILRRLAQQHPTQLQYQIDLAKACNFLGWQCAIDNNANSAVTRYQQACTYQEQLLASNPPGTVEARRDLAVYYADLGSVQSDMNHIAKSRASYERARQQLEPLAAQYPSDPELQAAFAVLCGSIGMHCAASDAIPWLNRGRAILETISAEHPDDGKYPLALAKFLTERAKRSPSVTEALAWQQQARDLRDRISHDFPLDIEIQRDAVWSLRDDARFLQLAGRQREAVDVLRRGMSQIDAVVFPNSAQKYSDFEIHVLATLARDELQLGNSSEYCRYCRALIAKCGQRNCYLHDGLRVCLLLPAAADDYEQLVTLAKDATSQGSRTLRKKTNVGGALYRAGRYDEAIAVLTTVDQSNQLALFAKLGTADIVRADNARVALFLAMAHAQLGQSVKAKTWFAKSRDWIEGRGRLFAVALNADSAGLVLEENNVSPRANGAGTPPVEPSVASAVSDSTSSFVLDLEDKVMLAEITFELQVLFNEARVLVDTK